MINADYLAQPCEFIETQFLTKIQAFQHCSSPVFVVKSDFNVCAFQDVMYHTLNVPAPVHIKRSVKKRRAEYLAGRYVARLAMKLCWQELSEYPNIGTDNNRAPIWPSGITGAITHSDNKAACIVSRSINGYQLGIDIETLSNNITDIGHHIYNTTELSVLTSSGFNELNASIVIFSAKEAIYKALYPNEMKFFGFEAFRLSAHLPERACLSFYYTGSDDLSLDYLAEIQVFYVMGESNVMTHVIFKGIPPNNVTNIG